MTAIDHRVRILAAIARTRAIGLQLAKVHVRDLESLLVDLERAEMRLAREALATFFGRWKWELRATRCACGHVGFAHGDSGLCHAACGCRAFVARTSPDAQSLFAGLACVFGEIGKAYATPCDCGHLSGQHRDDDDRTCPQCDCPGFFTAFDREAQSAGDSDSGAAVASLNTTTEAT